MATQFASPFAGRIIGTGAAFPATIVTNADISKRVDTTDEWIRERTGIRERRISKNETNPAEQNSGLAFIAATRALEMAGKRAEDLDQILYATCTPDTIVPSAACWLQSKLGAKNAFAVDLNAACSGFVFALSVAEKFMYSNSSKLSLVIGADVLNGIVNWDDRTSCILFGDGAGAAVVEQVPATSTSRILSTHIGSDGSLWELFHIPAGGSNLELTPERHAAAMGKMVMKGKDIYKHAVRTLTDYAVMALEKNGMTIKDLDWFVPHQANLRIIEAVAKRLEFPMEKILINIDRFGNTSSATVPTAFDEYVRAGKIKSGQTVLMDVFGVGLTYGSVLLRW